MAKALQEKPLRHSVPVLRGLKRNRTLMVLDIHESTECQARSGGAEVEYKGVSAEQLNVAGLLSIGLDHV
jgi:hypothetical protein